MATIPSSQLVFSQNGTYNSGSISVEKGKITFNNFKVNTTVSVSNTSTSTVVITKGGTSKSKTEEALTKTVGTNTITYNGSISLDTSYIGAQIERLALYYNSQTRVIQVDLNPFYVIASSDFNTSPTLNLTNPSDNLSLAEGNNYSVQGNASDSDSGNVMTVKYKINNGTARALASGVSDGSSPLSFAKTLTYSNKRIWDGSTDVYGADLAENVDHFLTVWSEDDQGGKSAEVTRKFRVVWNRPPTIDGSNGDLGTIQQPPSQVYTVSEPESDSFTITEKINGTVIRSFPGVAGRQETVTIPHDQWIRLDLDTPHALTVEATDSKGLTSIRTFTFTRTETHIEFMLNFDSPEVQGHFILDGMPERVLVTLERYIPEGGEIESVKVCNNALDAEPTWEDATIAVKGNRGFLFNNTNKTAANWAINIWVIIAKGTATERARLNGYGGAFD